MALAAAVTVMVVVVVIVVRAVEVVRTVAVLIRVEVRVATVRVAVAVLVDTIVRLAAVTVLVLETVRGTGVTVARRKDVQSLRRVLRAAAGLLEGKFTCRKHEFWSCSVPQVQDKALLGLTVWQLWAQTAEMLLRSRKKM